jgi:two-component system, sensor histidine kinase
MPYTPVDCFAAMPSPVRGAFQAAARNSPWTNLFLYAPDTGASAAGSAERDALRVLVVEDSLDVAETLERTLSGWGYSAKVCTSGQEALALAPYFRPMVVLIDIGLPDMTGWELARSLRDQSQNCKPVMIVITAYGDQADFEASQAAGISFHLVKPAFQMQLRQLLARLGGDRE